jgi:hypothetical protein
MTTLRNLIRRAADRLLGPVCRAALLASDHEVRIGPMRGFAVRG